MTSKLFLAIIVLLSSIGCAEQEGGTENSNTSNAEKADATFLPDLPAMTGEDFNWFVVNCTGIDYLMTTPDFSMSVNGQQDVRVDLAGISQNPVRRPASCKSIGMAIYKSGADRMFVADLFADENCQYIVFKEDNKELYANALSAEGYQRFVNVLNQINNMNQPQ